MTTAVAPKNADNWGDVFPDLPEQGEHWGTINGVLETFAIEGRFGFSNMPEGLTPAERVWLVYLRSWTKSGSPVEKIEKLRNSENEEDKKRFNEFLSGMGDLILFFVRIANAEPVVGHFVGRGFDQNKKDADAFLGNG